MNSPNLWDQLLSLIENKVNRHSYYTWFKPTSYVEEACDILRVRVPNALFRDWLAKHYSGVIGEALTEVGRRGVAIEFLTESDVAPALPLAAGGAARTEPSGSSP